MKNYLAILSLISLLLLSGCSTKRIDFSKYRASSAKAIKSLENIKIPFLNDLKVDPSVKTPTNISATPSMTEIALHWHYQIGSNTAGYRIFRYSEHSGKYILIETLPDIYTTSYVDKNLKPNKVYKYKISAYTKDKRVSVASPALSVTTKYTLQPSTSLVASKNYIQKIRLNWKLYPQYKLIKYYQIQRSKDKVKWEDLETIYKSLQTQYIDTRVKNGDAYYYRFYGVTYDGVKTPYSNISYGYSKTAPLVIKDVMVRSNLPRKIQLSWIDPNLEDKSRTILRYNIYTSLFRDKLFIKHASTTNKYFIDNVPHDGRKVYYKVTAVDNFGLESPLYPKAVMANTKASSMAPKIIEYKLVDGRVVIRWEPMSRNIRKYEVVKRYYSKFFLPKTLKYTDITSTQFVDKDISLNKTYKYKVIGIDNDGIPTKPSREISVEIK